MFCYNCGKEVSDGVDFCPECGANLSKKKDEKVKKEVHANPIGMVGIALAVVSAFIAFVLVTCALARNNAGMGLLDSIVILPAFAGLACGVYTLFAEKKGKLDKVFAIISIAVSCFALLYTLVGMMVVIIGPLN